MSKNLNVLFIAWEKHRRSEELCRHFEFPHYLMFSSLPRYLRHPYFVIITLKLLIKFKPRILMIQNPSIVLALLACFLKKMFHYSLVVDSHNGAIIPEGNFSQKFGLLYKYPQSVAEITIVTNKYLAKIVQENGGNALVLPDKIPNIKTSTLNCLRQEESLYKIVFICSFQIDEPYDNVFSAFKSLELNALLYITGNVTEKIKQHYRKICENIIFTGYLSDYDYWSLLNSSDLVIDLTIRENCLVCGAYEAIAVGVPLILSDTVLLREYFKNAVLYTDNSTADILENMLYALRNNTKCKSNIVVLKEQINSEWKSAADNFIDKIKPYSFFRKRIERS